MKKVLLPLLLLLLLTACGEAPVESEQWDFPPMVMVGDELYLDSGYESALTERCGTPDGTIGTSVDGWQRPTENDQSNFGTGYEYQITGEGTLELLIDDNWRIFETEEAREARQNSTPQGEESGEMLPSPPTLTLLVGEESFKALHGTSSWWYDNGDGTATGICLDSLHPLNATELMPVLPDAERVTLDFAILPDTVTAVYFVPDPAAEPLDADTKECEIEHLYIDTDKGCFDRFVLPLSSGAYVYEITAEWTRLPTCGGTARYSFRSE